MLRVVWGRHFREIVRLNALIFVVLIYLIICQGLSQQTFVKVILSIGFAETVVGMGYLTFRTVMDYRKEQQDKKKDM